MYTLCPTKRVTLKKKLTNKSILSRIEKEKLKSSDALVWMSISFLVIVSIFDFLILSQRYLELILLNLGSVVLILFSHFLLRKVQKDPILLLHIVHLILSFLLLFSISISDTIPQIFYMVMLAVAFVTFNVVAIWKVYDAIFQIVLLAILIYFFNYYEFLDVKNFFMMGGYTTFFICLISIVFPSIKTSSIEDELKMGKIQEDELRDMNDTVNTLKGEIKEMDAKFQYIDNKLKIFSHDLKNHLSSIKEHTSITDPNDEHSTKESHEHHINIIKDVLENANKITQQFFKDFKEGHLSDYQINNVYLDIHNIINKQLHELIHVSLSKNIQLDKNLDAKFTSVFGDTVVLNSIIYDLLTYTFSFSQNNDLVSISTTVDKDVLTLEILNRSTGMPMTTLESYFKTVAEHGFEDERKTTGLGLSLAKRNIEEMGGNFVYSASKSLGFEFIAEFIINKN